MRLLVDTSAYIQLKRGDEKIAGLVRTAEHLYVSIVVLGELYFGFHGGSRLRENLSELDEFLQHPFVSVAFLTRVSADRFGRIAAALKKSGTPIPTNDIWIAAHALELGAELVTFDEHFNAVPGLVVLNPGH
jgi:tRNA(fMet)-specific endonuclease VapC